MKQKVENNQIYDDIYIDFLNVQVFSTNIHYNTAGKDCLVTALGLVHSKIEEHFDPVKRTQNSFLKITNYITNYIFIYKANLSFEIGIV